MLYIATKLYVASLHNYAIVASGMYHIVFIKTEDRVVDEIGRIILCMFTSTSTRSYISLYNIIMHA